MSGPTDLVALSLLPIAQWRMVAERLRAGDAPAVILVELCGEPFPRLSPKSRPTADPGVLRARAHVALEHAATIGVQPILLGEEAYPRSLREIPDPPPVLWVKGSPSVLSDVAVAIVGSRAGSPYALSVAEQLAAEVAASGVVVVSGLARGVDSAAHRGALAEGRPTVGVLGCGADVVYPPENAPLFEKVCRKGAIVSELLPGTAPRRSFFPRRNRIISGLTRAVVVVEAGDRSGSLITARCALEQGRDVLAVPGNVLNGRNRGGHALLRDGARIVESARDIIDEIGLATSATLSDGPAARDPDPVLAALEDTETGDLDDICARSGLSIAELMPRLLRLELQGAVSRAPGGRFLRRRGNVLG